MEAVCAQSGSTASSLCCGSTLPFLPAAKKGPTPTLNALPYISSMNAMPDEIFMRGLSKGLFRVAACLEVRTD